MILFLCATCFVQGGSFVLCRTWSTCMTCGHAKTGNTGRSGNALQDLTALLYWSGGSTALHLAQLHLAQLLGWCGAAVAAWCLCMSLCWLSGGSRMQRQLQQGATGQGLLCCGHVVSINPSCCGCTAWVGAVVQMLLGACLLSEGDSGSRCQLARVEKLLARVCCAGDLLVSVHHSCCGCSTWSAAAGWCSSTQQGLWEQHV